MATVNLANIKLGYSPLTEQIYLCRHGKQPDNILDKRAAEKDVMAVLVTMMMDDAPKGSVKTFRLGDKHYKLTLEPDDKEKEDKTISQNSCSQCGGAVVASGTCKDGCCDVWKCIQCGKRWEQEVAQ